MNRRCENNVADHAVDVCDSCYGEFCDDCLIYPKTRSHPICKECGLIASGVRGNTKVKRAGDKKSARSRRAEIHQAISDAEEATKPDLRPAMYDKSEFRPAAEFAETPKEESETQEARQSIIQESEEPEPVIARSNQDADTATETEADSKELDDAELDVAPSFDIEENASRLSASFIERKTRAARRVELKTQVNEPELDATPLTDPTAAQQPVDDEYATTAAATKTRETSEQTTDIDALLAVREQAMSDYMAELEEKQPRNTHEQETEPEPTQAAPAATQEPTQFAPEQKTQPAQVQEFKSEPTPKKWSASDSPKSDADSRRVATFLGVDGPAETDQANDASSETDSKEKSGVDPISAKYGVFRDTRSNKKQPPAEATESKPVSADTPMSLRAKPDPTSEPVLPRHHIDENITHVEFDDLETVGVHGTASAPEDLFETEEPTFDTEALFETKEPTFDTEALFKAEEPTFDTEALFETKEPATEELQIELETNEDDLLDSEIGSTDLFEAKVFEAEQAYFGEATPVEEVTAEETQLEANQTKPKKAKLSKFGWLAKQKDDYDADAEELLAVTRPKSQAKSRRKEDPSEDLIQLTSSRSENSAEPTADDLQGLPPEPIYQSVSEESTQSYDSTSNLKHFDSAPNSPEEFWDHKVEGDLPEYAHSITISPTEG